MNDKDKWSAHLEYLKVAITLSTAILTVAAAIYSDATKIPSDASKYILLTSAIFVFLTLVTSITGVIHLSNFLIRPTDDKALDTSRANRITRAAGASFFSFLATGVCIITFFLMRTISSGVTLPASAIDSVSSILKKQITDPAERLVFERFEVKGAKYVIDYTIAPGSTIVRASVDTGTGLIETIERRP